MRKFIRQTRSMLFWTCAFCFFFELPRTSIISCRAFIPAPKSCKAFSVHQSHYISDACPLIDWNHIFQPTVKQKLECDKIIGLHSLATFSNKDDVTIIAIDHNGVFLGEFLVEKGGEVLKKFSTFFPMWWNEETTKQKIEEAYRGPLKKVFDAHRFVKTTRENIDILFCTKFTKNGELVISTAYPLLDKFSCKNVSNQ